MYSHFEHIALRGICAAVPSREESIAGLMEQADNATRFTLKRVAALAGLKKRHVAPPDIFTGDLAVAAGKELLHKLGWAPDSVDALFFVSQTPDFLSPPTGYLIAASLGLTENCTVMDISSGCPGMLHGAWLACAQMGKYCRRAIILSGDVSSKVIPAGDTGNSVLMGDGVGALALEYDESAGPLSFHLLSFPDTVFALVNYDSGYRPVTDKPDGMVMDGNKITEFCLARAPQCMQEHLKKEKLTLDDVDVFFLHQPNKMILDSLRRRLHIEPVKLPMIFADYANCSSASLAINACTSAMTLKGPCRAMFCAFGSGLSVASLLTNWEPSRAFPIVQVDAPVLLHCMEARV